MKRIIVLLLIALSMSTISWSQGTMPTDTVKTQPTSTVSKFSYDSLVAVAEKQHNNIVTIGKAFGVDSVTATNDSVVTTALVNYHSFLPGWPGTTKSWLKFIGWLVLIGLALFFAFTQHTLVTLITSIIAAFGSKTTVILILLSIGLLGVSGCTGSSHTFTANSVLIKEDIGKKGMYMEEWAILHSAPFQYDTAMYLVVMPDTLSNTLFKDIENFIQSKAPGLLPLSATKFRPVTK